MKTLIKKINRILKDRRIRRLLTRFVSGSAALVVFVTTYALVLPAITMETEAQCGIEAHQHDDSCYEDVLACGLEESDGHTHGDSCYNISQELTCEIPEHQHDKTCYDEDGNLQCRLSEHEHTEDCYKEVMYFSLCVFLQGFLRCFCAAGSLFFLLAVRSALPLFFVYIVSIAGEQS